MRPEVITAERRWRPKPESFLAKIWKKLPEEFRHEIESRNREHKDKMMQIDFEHQFRMWYIPVHVSLKETLSGAQEFLDSEPWLRQTYGVLALHATRKLLKDSEIWSSVSHIQIDPDSVVNFDGIRIAMSPENIQNSKGTVLTIDQMKASFELEHEEFDISGFEQIMQSISVKDE